MNLKSIIIDDFFDHPYQVKKEVTMKPFEDYKASDGVTYPGIVRLPLDVESQMIEGIRQVGFEPTSATMFARYSMKDTTPPHWAHSDYEMGDWTALIYMSDEPEHHKSGTYLLRHKKTGMQTHPMDEKEIKIWERDTNKRKAWDVVQYFEPAFNRMVLLNSRYFHAAGDSYGIHKGNSRLVLTTFFRV